MSATLHDSYLSVFLARSYFEIYGTVRDTVSFIEIGMHLLECNLGPQVIAFAFVCFF